MKLKTYRSQAKTWRTQKARVARLARLMPNGKPRYVRCYDNGGKSVDRYTVVLTGRAAKIQVDHWDADQWPYLAMDSRPFHPQGFGQHGFTDNWPADTFDYNGNYTRPPAIGRKCHLGTRIPFSALPVDCQTFILRDYREIWEIAN